MSDSNREQERIRLLNASGGGRITAEEVAQWFKDVRQRWVTDADYIVGFADTLEALRQHHSDPMSDCTLRPDSETWKQTRAAIITLEKKLPKFLPWAHQKLQSAKATEWHEAVSSARVRLAALGSLLDAASKVLPLVDWPSLPKRTAAWHEPAFLIEEWVRRCWGPADEVLGVGQETSPMVLLIERALARIGMPQTPAAIVSALDRK